MKKRLAAALLCCGLLAGCGAPEPLELPETPAETAVIAYVPLDDRPDNVGRVEYLAESLGYMLELPERDFYRTALDGQPLNQNGTQAGDPAALYDWVLEQEENGCDRYILSMDQMLYGGLVASREAERTTEREGESWPLTDLLEHLLTALAEDENNQVWLLDSVMRLAPTVGYGGYTLEDYNTLRAFGAEPRETLSGEALTLENIWNTYDTAADGGSLMNFGNDGAMTGKVVDYMEHRLNKLFLSGELLKTVSRLGGERFHVLIGIDDSALEDCIQKNEIAYLRSFLREGDAILSGVDDLAFKAVAKLYLKEIGWQGAAVSVQYFGGTEDRPACDYDYQPLTEIVAEHIDYFGMEQAAEKKQADLHLLVLTQPEDAEKKQTYIKDLTTELKRLQKNGALVILIDAGNGQYGAALQETLTKEVELGQLLSYAGFLDMAIVTGTALSHGAARYAHLVRGGTSQAEESAFQKTLADSILKDFCYKHVVREDILAYVRNDLGGDPNNFWQPAIDRDAVTARMADGMETAVAEVVKNLETSGFPLDLEGTWANWGKLTLSNYHFPWDRAFEIDMELETGPLTRR